MMYWKRIMLLLPKAGHLSTICPAFPILTKKVWQVKHDEEPKEQILSLREEEDDDEDIIRQVSFSTDF